MVIVETYLWHKSLAKIVEEIGGESDYFCDLNMWDIQVTMPFFVMKSEYSNNSKDEIFESEQVEKPNSRLVLTIKVLTYIYVKFIGVWWLVLLIRIF